MSDMFRLDGKVAVVIGGAGGIGEIMAKGMAAQGAKVVIASRNIQKLEGIAKQIQSETKSETLALPVDVVKMDSVWSIDWKVAFSKSPTLTFMKDADRDALGEAFNAYRWWADAKAGAKEGMPSAPLVHHYHPIVMLLQMAYSP